MKGLWTHRFVPLWNSSWKQPFSSFTNTLNSKDSPDLVWWQVSTVPVTSLRDQNWRDDFSQNHPFTFYVLMNISFLWLLNLWNFGGSGSVSFSLGGSDCFLSTGKNQTACQLIVLMIPCKIIIIIICLAGCWAFFLFNPAAVWESLQVINSSVM